MSDDGNTLEVIDGGLSEPPCESVGMPQQEPPQAPYEYQTSDPVDSPAHYRRGDVEAIEIIEHIVSSYKDPVQSFLVGQILKYLIRAPLKWNQAEDLKKGHWYYRRLVEKTR